MGVCASARERGRDSGPLNLTSSPNHVTLAPQYKNVWAIQNCMEGVCPSVCSPRGVWAYTHAYTRSRAHPTQQQALSLLPPYLPSYLGIEGAVLGREKTAQASRASSDFEKVCGAAWRGSEGIEITRDQDQSRSSPGVAVL